MSAFTDPELAYLTGERRLARIATIGKDGTPHVVPLGWSYNREHDTIDVGGRQLEQAKKFRDVARSRRAAVVIDDLASTNPWHPRAVEVRGRAEAIKEPEAIIRIHPQRIIGASIAHAHDRTGRSLYSAARPRNPVRHATTGAFPAAAPRPSSTTGN